MTYAAESDHKRGNRDSRGSPEFRESRISSGTTLSHVYFPTTSIVSLLYVMENGSSAEIAVVGNEGIVGISLFATRRGIEAESSVPPCGW
jgi:hypothetical protein